MTSLVEKLMLKAFSPGRPPRSAAYRSGCRITLESRLAGARFHCPYQESTAEFDAFFAGHSEGVEIWREYLQSLKNREVGQ